MLRYFPRLRVFKASNNYFDGVEARSYNWYVYAHVLLNGDYIMVERSYSSTTSGHMNDFRSLIGDKKEHRLLAPRGLGDIEGAEREIKSSIMDMKAQLANPRNRKLEWRRERLAQLEGMKATLRLLKADLKARRKAEEKARKAAEKANQARYSEVA